MDRYEICKALGYGKVGETISLHDSFGSLIKEVKKMFKKNNKRFLVTKAHTDFILFSGLQVEDHYLDPSSPIHKLTLESLKDNFRYDFYSKEYMYT